jgi:hypothetical protein
MVRAHFVIETPATTHWNGNFLWIVCFSGVCTGFLTGRGLKVYRAVEQFFLLNLRFLKLFFIWQYFGVNILNQALFILL